MKHNIDNEGDISVVACPRCRNYFLPSTGWRQQDSLTCSQCGSTRAPRRYRQVAKHPRHQGAAELRSRQLARDADHGPEYAGVDDYGVLEDRLRDRETVVPSAPENGWHPELFATAAETIDVWNADAFAGVEDALGWADDWFEASGAEAHVPHPQADLVEVLVDERDEPGDGPAAEAGLPEAGNLTLTTDRVLSPACSVTLNQNLPAPTTLQKRLFEPDSQVSDQLVDALQAVASELPPEESLAEVLIEGGVTALNGMYARIASTAGQYLARGDGTRLWKWLAVTRALGGQTPLDIGSTLEDIERGPVALCALSDATPTVEFRLERSFFEANSTQRRRLLHHLSRLTPGFNIRVVGSRLCLRRLIDVHSDELPTSVSERAHQRLRSRDAAKTITEERALAAEGAIEELGVDHPAWTVCASIARAQLECRSFADLYSDDQFAVSDSGMRRRVATLRDADLVETPRIEGGKQAVLTSLGQTALEKHPDFDIDEETGRPQQLGSTGSDSRFTHDVSAQSPIGSSADGSMEHTEQTKSNDVGPSDSAVCDPRNDRNSTVLSQHAQERGGMEGGEDTSQACPSSSSPSESSPSTEFLSLAEHHGTAAASSLGHIALVERSVSDTDESRDHRQGRFSYDGDRDEIVVSVDFSSSMALTSVRLCAVLLSDHAFEQVLTPERLANHPDGQSLDGLEITNPYVLRDAVCIGWLRDVDATGIGLRNRLEQARRDLLAMTTDLSNEHGIDGEIASELLRKAHGLMGVALRLYSLLGVDVVREIQFPSGIPTGDTREEFRKFISIATSIGSRYGAYSAYRVLHEERPNKREQLLSEPDVDPGSPEGTLLGPWVFSGPNVGQLDELSRIPADLDLQDNGEKFAPFRLQARVVDGNRRQAVGEAVTRILSFKRGLRPERQAISLLAALSSDVVAAAEAIAVLGSEDSQRKLDMQDIRYGLSQLSWQQLVPDLGGRVISKVIRSLLDVQEHLSTAELADQADCSARSLSTETNHRVFAELEAMGVLDREDLGEGKSTMWRLNLSFRFERHSEEPVPKMLVGEGTTPSGGVWHLSNAVCEVLTTAADNYGVAYGIPFGGEAALAAFAGAPPIDRELEPLVNQYPEIKPVVSILAILLDQGDRLTDEGGCSSFELGMPPDPNQSTLSRAVVQHS